MEYPENFTETHSLGWETESVNDKFFASLKVVEQPIKSVCNYLKGLCQIIYYLFKI